MNLLVKYCFEELLMKKVFLKVYSDNKRAIKSYEKAGFKPVTYMQIYK